MKSLSEFIYHVKNFPDHLFNIDRATYAHLLRQCTACRSLDHGKLLHSHIGARGRDSDTLLANLLVHMYSACSCAHQALSVFNRIRLRNVYSWTILFTAFAQNGETCAAKHVFDLMPQRGLVSMNSMLAVYARDGCVDEVSSLFKSMPEVDVISWNSVLLAVAPRVYVAWEVFERMPAWNETSWSMMVQALVSNDHLDLAESMVDQAPEKTEALCCMLVTAYAQRGNLQRAREVFKEIDCSEEASVCNVLIAAYGNNEHCLEAEEVFSNMKRRDVVTWNSMISVHAGNGDPVVARKFLDKMPQHDTVPWTAAMHGYAHVGDSVSSKEMFDGMVQKNVVSWNTMVNASAAEAKEASRSVFNSMPVQNTAAYNAMLTGYCLNGLMDEALILFVEMPGKDVISWSSMIVGFLQSGSAKTAVLHFWSMELEGIKPDEMTFIAAVDACAASADVLQGRLLHSEIKLSGYELNLQVANSLVGMYGKSGQLSEARKLFDNSPKRATVLWNTMMSSYSQNGFVKQALELLEEMQLDGINPTAVTYVVALSACSHMGLVELGKCHFISMVVNYGLVPAREHEACMVDLLSRAGLMESAAEVGLDSADESTLTALLGACRNHGNGKIVERMLGMEHKSGSFYVLMSNISMINV